MNKATELYHIRAFLNNGILRKTYEDARQRIESNLRLYCEHVRPEAYWLCIMQTTPSPIEHIIDNIIILIMEKYNNKDQESGNVSGKFNEQLFETTLTKVININDGINDWFDAELHGPFANSINPYIDSLKKDIAPDQNNIQNLFLPFSGQAQKISPEKAKKDQDVSNDTTDIDDIFLYPTRIYEAKEALTDKYNNYHLYGRITDWLEDTKSKAGLKIESYDPNKIINNLPSDKQLNTRNEFDDICMFYSILCDYIDMVHDTTHCIEYMQLAIEYLKLNETNSNNQLFKSQKYDYSIIFKKLNDTITRLCSGVSGNSYGNIRVPESHVLHKELITEFIDEVNKLLGTHLPPIPDTIMVTHDNAAKTLEFLDTTDKNIVIARESGRKLKGYVEDYAKSVRVNSLPANKLGAIDGCTDSESILSEQIMWRYSVAGFIKLQIYAEGIPVTHPKAHSYIHVSVGNDSMLFEVKGEIILDDVVSLINDKDKLGYRNDNYDPKKQGITIIPDAETYMSNRIRDNDIKFNNIRDPLEQKRLTNETLFFKILTSNNNYKYINKLNTNTSSQQLQLYQKQLGLHRLMILSLKTICDKRLIQRIQEMIGTRYKHLVKGITTKDGYVPNGYALAYVRGDIRTCPNFFLDNSEGYKLVPEYNAFPNIEGIYYPRLIDLSLHKPSIIINNDDSGDNPIHSIRDKTDMLFTKINNLFNEHDERAKMTFWDTIRYIIIMSQSKSYVSKKIANYKDMEEAIRLLNNAVNVKDAIITEPEPEHDGDATFMKGSESNSDPTQLLQNALDTKVSPPPSVVDIFEFLDEESDITDIFPGYDFGNNPHTFISSINNNSMRQLTEKYYLDEYKTKYKSVIEEFKKKRTDDDKPLIEFASEKLKTELEDVVGLLEEHINNNETGETEKELTAWVENLRADLAQLDTDTELSSNKRKPDGAESILKQMIEERIINDFTYYNVDILEKDERGGSLYMQKLLEQIISRQGQGRPAGSMSVLCRYILEKYAENNTLVERLLKRVFNASYVHPFVYNTRLPQIGVIGETYRNIENEISAILETNISSKTKFEKVDNVLKKYKVKQKAPISSFLPNYNNENIVFNKGDSQYITITYSGHEEILWSTNVLPEDLSPEETKILDITKPHERIAKPPKRKLLIPASIELLINILENYELARRVPEQARDIFRDNIITHIADRVYSGLPPPDQPYESGHLSKEKITGTLTEIWKKVQSYKPTQDNKRFKQEGDNSRQQEQSVNRDLAKDIINSLFESYKDELTKHAKITGPETLETPVDKEMSGGASDQHLIRLIRHPRNKSLTKNTDASNSHRCSCYPRKCEIGVCSRLSKKTHDNIAPETTQSLNNTKKRYRQHTLRNMRPLFPKNASNRKY
jgi:hypothetical protein